MKAYNNELKEIDTPDKAYLLGLFYSDGNISLNQQHTRLFLNDSQIIFDLFEKFNFFYLLKSRKQMGLQSGLREIRTHLVENGMYPRKSFENRNKLRIPFYNEFTFDFIRGYYDGNGGCTLTPGKEWTQKRVYFYSRSVELLKDIENFFNQYNISSSTTLSSNEVYKLTVSTKSYKLLYDNLYKDRNLYIKRKKDKLEALLKTNIFIQRIAPKCEFCGNSNTVFNGHCMYKQRILCKDCNKNFYYTGPITSNSNSGGDELLEH